MPAVLRICRGAEEQTLPKVADDRDVMSEIKLRNIREDVADDVVDQHARVENVHEPVDVTPGRDIVHSIWFHYWQADHTHTTRMKRRTGYLKHTLHLLHPC